MNFEIAFNFIKTTFLNVISAMDNMLVFGRFTVLDFNIALLILGAVLPIVLVTVSNWSSVNVMKEDARRASVKRQEYNKALFKALYKRNK